MPAAAKEVEIGSIVLDRRIPVRLNSPERPLLAQRSPPESGKHDVLPSRDAPTNSRAVAHSRPRMGHATLVLNGFIPNLILGKKCATTQTTFNFCFNVVLSHRYPLASSIVNRTPSSAAPLHPLRPYVIILASVNFAVSHTVTFRS